MFVDCTYIGRHFSFYQISNSAKAMHRVPHRSASPPPLPYERGGGSSGWRGWGGEYLYVEPAHTLFFRIKLCCPSIFSNKNHNVMFHLFLIFNDRYQIFLKFIFAAGKSYLKELEKDDDCCLSQSNGLGWPSPIRCVIC
jgi:hypothetical protein